MSIISPTVEQRPVLETHENRIVRSALWAAAGDAIGWITELSRGTAGVAHRAGTETVYKPVAWQRNIGGRSGPRVDFPAGTYSDDTQLRLAVSRAIRGDGFFDAEAFAKIELTIWPNYALGGGLGTKAAATNLARRSVNWFSNFFDSGDQKYVNSGGNGAAMRIQPHVWAASRSSPDMILNVLRDSLITHGHPHGFCGAIFHALCVEHALQKGSIPSENDWRIFIDKLREVDGAISYDPQLATFWRSAWENQVGKSVELALADMRLEALQDLDVVCKVLDNRSPNAYYELLAGLGCLTKSFRGSGFKTALAAAALALIHKGDETPEVALGVAANQLESDTDTIATMAGAILGCLAKREPGWSIQDRSYITQEARRLAGVSQGQPQDSFNYPDVGHWNPPASQTASVGSFEGRLAIAGLGYLEPVSKEYPMGDAVWQWMSLPFGQNIMTKRKVDQKYELPSSQLPGPRQGARFLPEGKPHRQLTLAGIPSDLKPTSSRLKQTRTHERGQTASSQEGLDTWTSAVITSDFDDKVLGQYFNRCLEHSGDIESAIAFAGIIAKAKLSRQRRGR